MSAIRGQQTASTPTFPIISTRDQAYRASFDASRNSLARESRIYLCAGWFIYLASAGKLWHALFLVQHRCFAERYRVLIRSSYIRDSRRTVEGPFSSSVYILMKWFFSLCDYDAEHVHNVGGNSC
mmetsp:Transcript_1987/g.7115  ORF Transcript_1987/g.7115 Transcript_1987/m.7115 type:complete len:125 (+) Transcript_1987:1439-1813(+)